MSDGLTMQTSTNGGIGKALGRMFSGDKMFQNIYTANADGQFIAFASSFVGDILALDVAPGQEYICQKSAFLASTMGVNMSVYFKKSLKTGMFGGEGLFNTVVTGPGEVIVQSMPAAKMAEALKPFFPQNTGGNIQLGGK